MSLPLPGEETKERVVVSKTELPSSESLNLKNQNGLASRLQLRFEFLRPAVERKKYSKSLILYSPQFCYTTPERRKKTAKGYEKDDHHIFTAIYFHNCAG